MILEAAKSIAAATSALVKAASSAQRELIDNGKVNFIFSILKVITSLINHKFKHQTFKHMKLCFYLCFERAQLNGN